MKMTLKLLFLCLFSFTVAAAGTSRPPVFQMRLVVDSPSADTEEMSIVGSPKDAGKSAAYHVQKKMLIDQADLDSARVDKDSLSGGYVIEIGFTKEGKKHFAEVTHANIGRRLAFVIDGKLYSAPVIRTEIPGGRARISGSFTEKEARELVARITDTLKKR